MAAPSSALTDRDIARWTRIGLLAALAMALSYLETFIPLPLPGVKLGLANIPVLIALARGDIGGAFYVGALKVLSLGLLFGNPVSLLYSLAGTLLAFAAMAPLSRLPGLRLELVSICGALAHEVGQLVVAMVLLGTPLVWYSAPLLLIAGTLTGFACGWVAAQTLALLDDDPHGKVPAPVADGSVGAGAGADGAASASGSAAGAATPLKRAEVQPRIRVSARLALVAFIVFAVVALHATRPATLGALFALACLACFAGRVSLRTLARALVPTAAILAITFIAQVASLQQGTVLALIGPIALTREAVAQALVMTARLAVLVMASTAVMNLVPPRDLVQALSRLLSPFKRFGLKTDGPVYALEVALATVPALIELATSTERNWRDWRHEFPAFIAQTLAP